MEPCAGGGARAGSSRTAATSPDLLALADALFAAATDRDPRRLASHCSPRFAVLEIQEGGERREIAREALLSMLAGAHHHQ